MLSTASAPPNPALAHAFDANMMAFYQYLARLPGAQVHHSATLCRVMTKVPLDMFNGVCYAAFNPDTLDQQIAAALTPFRQHLVPMAWQLGPTTHPAEIDQALAAHGLAHIEDEPAMALDLTTIISPPSPPTTLSIRPVTDDDQLWAWVRTWAGPLPEEILQGFWQACMDLGLDQRLPLRHYLGLQDGIPVATGTLFLGGGVASVQNIVTDAPFRRQGIGSAMTHHILHEARAEGQPLALLTSSPEGFGVYQRLGFRQFCLVRRYGWTPPPPTRDTLELT